MEEGRWVVGLADDCYDSSEQLEKLLKMII